MANPYSWLTFAQAKSEVSLRLGDPNQIFWTNIEVGLYLTEALRVYNCLTQFWAEPYTFDLTPPLTGNWFPANGTGSPRVQTLTDTSIYTLIEYHLLEPPTGATWTGTNQFSLSDLSQACSRRRNEILQDAACNMVEQTISVVPNTNNVTLPDTVLDVRRVRWVPVTGSPVTLQRGDTLSFQRFSVKYAQTAGNPLRWDVLGSPPQQITLDANANLPSSVQVLGIDGAVDFNPPPAAGLLIPDDWMWVLKFGALSDILSKEQEGKDLERATYCRQRYEEGLKLMKMMPWLLQAFINGVPVDFQSVAAADRFNYEWQSRSTAFPEIVIGGIDLFAVSPVPTALTAITLQVVANAPVPVLDADQIQVPRDMMDAIISEAQHLALFKMGGAEFAQSMALHQEFVGMCMTQNKRLRESGIFPTDLRPSVPKQDQQQPRFAGKE